MNMSLDGKFEIVPSELPAELLLNMYDLMLKARVLEERMMTMYKQGNGYFWIGGPGEEAFNVALGLLVEKGEGLAYDYLHLHYRSSATMLALGAEPIDAFRQMKTTATDPYSGGRGFCNHYSIPKWNVVPVTSVIEAQFSMAPGTAIAQKRYGGQGITIVQGGDAGTAEGDFSTCLIWSSRKGNELPVLMIVTNNRYGISTPFEGQHGEKYIADRGKAFGMPTAVIDGNDPEVSYLAIKQAMAYVRTERKPFLLEATVSRLYGHSSASGANFVASEEDSLAKFEKKLQREGLLTQQKVDEKRAGYFQEFLEASKKVRDEPQPQPHDVWSYVFAEKNSTSGEL